MILPQQFVFPLLNSSALNLQMSFKREIYLDWSLYNHLELRVRGDGRTYLLNISTAGYFDLHWNDMYSYPLYTRGGPHWQVTKVRSDLFFALQFLLDIESEI